MKMIFTLRLLMNVALFSRDPPLQQNLTLQVAQFWTGYTIFWTQFLSEWKTCFFSVVLFNVLKRADVVLPWKWPKLFDLTVIMISGCMLKAGRVLKPFNRGHRTSTALLCYLPRILWPCCSPTMWGGRGLVLGMRGGWAVDSGSAPGTQQTSCCPAEGGSVPQQTHVFSREWSRPSCKVIL